MNCWEWEKSDIEGLCQEARDGSRVLFHVTWASRLSGILDKGILVGGSHSKRNRWIGGSETRKRCLGRIFLTGDERVAYWVEQMEENLDPPTADDTIVVLAIDATALELAPDREYPGDLISGQPITLDRLRGILEGDFDKGDIDKWAQRQQPKRRQARVAPVTRAPRSITR